MSIEEILIDEPTLHLFPKEVNESETTIVSPQGIEEYFGIWYLEKSLIPSKEPSEKEEYHVEISLKQEEIDTGITESDGEICIKGKLECVTYGDETWLDISIPSRETSIPSREFIGELTLNKERVPDWISEEGDTAYVKIQIAKCE